MALRQTYSYNQYRGHTLQTAPASEPVSADDVKAQLELDASDTSKDTQIELYITAAREMLEQFSGLALITQTWKLTLDCWPADRGAEPWWSGVRDTAIYTIVQTGRAAQVFLPRYPLQSVSSITADGESVTVADVFVVDTQEKPGRLVKKGTATWPTVLDTANGIEVVYVAGYGASAADVPAALRLAIIQMAAYMFEHRGDCNTQDALEMSGAASMVNAYKVRGL
jgi:uncharacterized phiE125 gp8 family phage protein